MFKYISNHRYKSVIVIVTLLITLGFIFIALLNIEGILPKKEIKARTWQQIKSSGIINIVTLNNSTSYFIYKGRPMGFQHDLAEHYAKSQNLSCQFFIQDNFKGALEMINSGKADLIAMDLTPTHKRMSDLLFTENIGLNPHVLVRKAPTTNKVTKFNIHRLNQKTIYIQKGSVFGSTIKNIEKQYDIEIKIIETEEGMEQLINKVAEGTIEYTLCDERLANAVKTYEDRIEIVKNLSKPYKLCWAVSIKSDSLRNDISNWLVDFKKTKSFKNLELRYFTIKKKIYYSPQQNNEITPDKLCKYDSLIKLNAIRLGWDWRLLAAVIYHESKFSPTAESWAGAQGLLQLMPNTGKNFNLINPFNPEQNLKAGTSLLIMLENRFADQGITGVELQKFTIAAFHSGYGHVKDAINLAKKYKINPTIWTHHVDSFMIKKSYAKYYNQSVVKNGYSHGYQTVKYVNDVFYLYHHYQNLIQMGSKN